MIDQTLSPAQCLVEDESQVTLNDIEQAIRPYSDFFRDKVVLCYSEIASKKGLINYFIQNFGRLKLKRLIVIINRNISDSKKNVFYKLEIADAEEVGDYKSVNPSEYKRLVKRSDVVVSFLSIFSLKVRMVQLVKLNQKFLVMTNLHVATNKAIFSLINNHEIWMDYRQGDICYFTNLDVQKCYHIYYKEYSPDYKLLGYTYIDNDEAKYGWLKRFYVATKNLNVQKIRNVVYYSCCFVSQVRTDTSS